VDNLHNPSGGPAPYSQSYGHHPLGQHPFGQPVVVQEPKMPWSKAIAVTIAAFLLAGAIAGWAWQQFAPLAKYTVDENGGSLGEEQMTKVFGPDGLFTAIGFLTALVLGGLLFWWLRNYGPWAVGIVVLGSGLGAGVAWGVGMLLGHDPLQPRLEASKPGDLLDAPLELHTWTPLAAWLVGAALAAAILAATTWRADPVATGSVPAASESSPQVH
jgi:MFS family permease